MVYKSLVLLSLVLFTLLAACGGISNNEGTQNASEPPTTANTSAPQETPVNIAETPPNTATEPVEILGDCAVSATFPDDTTCTKISVSCAGLPALNGEIRITQHQPDVPYLGIVLLASGGNGHGFLSGDSPTLDSQPLNIVLQLREAGFKVVERKWPDGWFGESSLGLGLVDPSCRLVEILKWLDAQTEIPEEAMCAYGNSGGSSELAYGLTRWNTETLLDAVVLGGGPPTSRLAESCLGFQSYPEWEQTCTEIWTETQTECGQKPPACTFADSDPGVGQNLIDQAFTIAELNHLCTGSSQTFAPLFEENSVLSPNADLAYPDTAVHFILGRQDCSIAATQGPLYYDAITTEKSIEYLEGVPHELYDSPAGAEAVVNAVTNLCVAGQ